MAQAVASAIVAVVVGCDDEDGPACPQDPDVVRLLSTSLHHTTESDDIERSMKD